jgi:multiple sugar transport system permease protein
MGLASAQAWLLFIIILAMTIILVRTSRRWVYYAGES